MGLRCSGVCVSLFVCCEPAPAAEPKLPILGRIIAKRPEVLSGTFSGMVVTLFMPKDVVRTWLPSGLQLAKECPYAEHPVVILFGSIDDLAREKVVTVKPRFGRHYLKRSLRFRTFNSSRLRKQSPCSISSASTLTASAERFRGFGNMVGRDPHPHRHHRGDLSNIPRGFRAGLGGRDGVRTAQADRGREPFLETDPGDAFATHGLKARSAFHLYSFDFHFASSSNNSIPVRLELREGFMPKIKPMKGQVPGIADSDFGAFYIECRYTKTPLDAVE